MNTASPASPLLQPVEVGPSGSGPAEGAGASAGSAPCLAGLKVLDLTQVIAGPYCAQQLALLGADVTKAESPGGDPLRWRGGSDEALAAQGLSTHFQAHAAGRRFTQLDWTNPAGIASLKQALQGCDVLLSNLRAHVLPRGGAGPDALLREFPRLVICTISGYAGDACGDWPAYDNTIQAASGLMRINAAQPSGGRVGAPIVDYAAGMAALSAILAALMERTRSGKGQHVRVNMLAVAHQLMTAQRVDLQKTGRAPVYKGNRANSGEPLSMVFETAQGHLALGVNEKHQFAKLAHVLGRLRWLDDVRLATPEQRRLHAAPLQAEVQALLMRQTAVQWEAVLNAAGVAAAAVRDLPDSLSHPGAENEPALFQLERGAKVLADLAPPQAHPDAARPVAA